MLRFLQERVIERVGGRQEIPVDVRVVCATHRDLQELIKADQFREDLYYRISEITINIPPLRVRTGDALLLARNFLEKFGRQNNRALNGFTIEAQNCISSYSWPGNVRELENKVKRAVIMAEQDQLTAEDLELEAFGSEDNKTTILNLRQAREQAELDALRQALNLSKNNISHAAELLGISRPTLYDLMNKFGFN
jgi:two-component system NtrC family response regulator